MGTSRENMRSCFEEKKATEMAAYLLEKSGGKMYYLQLIKLLYIADREALRRWGYPLTGDSYFSLPHGPVPSRIKDLVTDDPQFSGSKFWTSYIRTENYEVKLQRKAPLGSLSQADIELLDEIFDKYGQLERFELADMTHEFPEWQDPQGSRIPITYEEILRAVGREEDAEELVEEIESHNLFMQHLLNSS
ncbi:MAG: Panacea domain-containing protein [Candidatus Bipolaricaulia bacterium]